ncbi:MAG: zinc ribbon domain-containing protein [Deltaproteobacteria bacterium]|nr:zinc ribbon domain-containing protein [Deltaproteobacteria bacterium]
MPIYEYVCQSCGKEFEEMQRFSDAPLEQCLCDEKAPVQRKVSKSAFHLKGGGWYKDGYGSAKPESSEEGNKESKNNESGTESKKSDSSTESKKSDSSTESSSKESKPAESSKSSDSSSSSSSSGGKENAA